VPEDDGGPDLTRIEFTTADLPEDPPVQDPGPVSEAALAQSQQQQQSKDPSLLDTRKLASSLWEGPAAGDEGRVRCGDQRC
jgi:hypothetical protein